MAKHLIVVEDAKDWPREEPEGTVLNFRDYLLGSAGSSASRIVNLCRGYAYQGNGYYCSLMAEARGQRTLPTVRTISDLSRRALYSLDLDVLNDRLKKLVGAIDGATDTVTMRVFFGQSEFPGLEELGREVFELFPAPILSLRLHKGRNWRIDTVTTGSGIYLVMRCAISLRSASMLLPALRNARESGRMAVCLSNLHQVGLAG